MKSKEFAKVLVACLDEVAEELETRKEHELSAETDEGAVSLDKPTE